MQVSLESPDRTEVIALIQELDDCQDSLYPPESRHALDLASLRQPHLRFAVVRAFDLRAIGCGALVLGPDGHDPRGAGAGVRIDAGFR